MDSNTLWDMLDKAYHVPRQSRARVCVCGCECENCGDDASQEVEMLKCEQCGSNRLAWWGHWMNVGMEGEYLLEGERRWGAGPDRWTGTQGMWVCDAIECNQRSQERRMDLGRSSCLCHGALVSSDAIPLLARRDNSVFVGGWNAHPNMNSHRLDPAVWAAQIQFPGGGSQSFGPHATERCD